MRKATKFKHIGFQGGVAAPTVFHNLVTGVRVVVHGNDFTVFGCHSELTRCGQTWRIGMRSRCAGSLVARFMTPRRIRSWGQPFGGRGSSSRTSDIDATSSLQRALLMTPILLWRLRRKTAMMIRKRGSWTLGGRRCQEISKPTKKGLQRVRKKGDSHARPSGWYGS